MHPFCILARGHAHSKLVMPFCQHTSRLVKSVSPAG
jgi:hypothetical protein